MSLGDLTFHSLYIIIYLMFDLFRVVFFCNLLFYDIACYICCCNRHIVVMCTYIPVLEIRIRNWSAIF